jgi:hypothetical protein
MFTNDKEQIAVLKSILKMVQQQRDHFQRELYSLMADLSVDGPAFSIERNAELDRELLESQSSLYRQVQEHEKAMANEREHNRFLKDRVNALKCELERYRDNEDEGEQEEIENVQKRLLLAIKRAENAERLLSDVALERLSLKESLETEKQASRGQLALIEQLQAKINKLEGRDIDGEMSDFADGSPFGFRIRSLFGVFRGGRSR